MEYSEELTIKKILWEKQMASAISGVSLLNILKPNINQQMEKSIHRFYYVVDSGVGQDTSTMLEIFFLPLLCVYLAGHWTLLHFSIFLYLPVFWFIEYKEITQDVVANMESIGNNIAMKSSISWSLIFTEIFVIPNYFLFRIWNQ